MYERVVFRRSVQFLQGSNRFPREPEARCGFPRLVGRPLLDGRRRGINDGEEVHFAGVSGRILKGVENAWRPVVQLQPAQCFEFPSRPRFGVGRVDSRQVVQMQDHPILSG